MFRVLTRNNKFLNTNPKQYTKLLKYYNYFSTKIPQYPQAYKKSTNQTIYIQAPNNNNNNNQTNNSKQNNTENNNDSLGNQDDNNNNNNVQDKPPKLRTVPIRNIKIELTTQEEKEQIPQEYILFSSYHPILPHIESPGVVKQGNLSINDFNNPLCHFLQAPNGEIYTIGLILTSEVNKHLKKKNQENQENSINSNVQDEIGVVTSETKAQIGVKKQNYRVKLTEITIKNNCIYCSAIPYKDKQLTKGERSLNLEHELELIGVYCTQIKQLAHLDRIEVFRNFDVQRINTKGLSHTQIDTIIYKIIQEILVLSNYNKESFLPFVQTILEERTVASRLIMLRIKLEDLAKMLELVNTNLRQAEDYLHKLTQQTKAKLSIDQIKNNFLVDQQQYQSQSQQSQSLNNTIAKQFYDKLYLIKDEVSREKIKKEIDRFSQIDKMNSEYHKIYTYLDEVFSIPWNHYTPEIWDPQHTQNIINTHIHGLHKVKQRIIEMVVHNQLLNTHLESGQISTKYSQGFIILLTGPPGIGKTSIAKAIGQALQRSTRLISFAGISDIHFMKGHRRTYADSQPGVFIKELIKAQTSNPVFILDEIDKISKNNIGADPYQSLMEILNPEENSNFLDHYLDIKVDFSKVVFILTANSIFQMLEPLRNRLEIIEIPEYIEQEKIIITKNHLIPNILQNTGLEPNSIQFDDKSLSYILKGWCYLESGVREVKRCIEKISRKYAVEIQTEQDKLDPAEQNQTQFPPLKLLSDSQDYQIKIKKYLGNPPFDEEYEKRILHREISGICNILTVGGGFIGKLLTVECNYNLAQPEQKGLFTSSGNLNKVIQESLLIAKVTAARYLNEEQRKIVASKNIHIHFTEGAIPKDGPSAGISICSAYLSLILNKPLSPNLSMTGELSLSGEVHKIGGLQAKLTASKAMSVNKVIIPYGNLGEFNELPEMLKEGMTVYFVKNYDEVYQLLFENTTKQDINIYHINKFINDSESLPLLEKLAVE